MKKTNSKVDSYFKNEQRWKAEYQKLRSIVLDCGLSEELKWGQACYTSEGKNIVLIHGFKEYCALLFFKGALLKDPKKLLIQQTENVQAGRQIRFTNVKEIAALAPALKAYVREAIAVEKSSLKVKLKKTSEFAVPAEFQQKLDQVAALKSAFHALTPGRQRGYLLYFSSAKQAKTRESRIATYTPQILKGMGLND